MDDDFDIYGDLDGFENDVNKESKIIKELKADIEELKVKISEKESAIQLLANKNEILLENISSLLLTAKAELKRKDLLIADVRRQMDNAAFRRNKNSAVKHTQGTQTTMIRMMCQHVQTDNVGTTARNGARFREKTKERSPFKKSRREQTTSHDRKKTARQVDLRDRIREKVKTTADSSSEKGRNITQRWDTSRDREKERKRERERERVRERQREIEQRTRHRETVRTPEVSPVCFSQPLRISRQGHGESDAKLSQTFIPMNREELDQYVKEIARKENRSPDECNPGSNRKNKNMLDTSNSELWDAGLSQKKMEPCPVKVVENIIQSDEIGTTLSPGNVEDVEQKMRILLGEPTPMTPKTPVCLLTSRELLAGLNRSFGKTIPPQPPTLVIPPLEPPIIEQVPEIPNEDDPRLNDSRELKIVESEEMLAEQVCDQTPIETVIATWREPKETDDIEDGEIVSSDGHSVHEDNDQNRSHRILSADLESKRKKETKQKSRNDRKSLDKLENSDERKHTRRSRKSEGFKKYFDSKSNESRKAKFDTSTPTRRRKSEKEKQTITAKTKPTNGLSKTEKNQKKISMEELHSKSRKETLKDLFGSEDENSLCETPSTGKRKYTTDVKDCKDSKKRRIRSKEKDKKNEDSREIHCSKSAEVIKTSDEVVRIQPTEDHLQNMTTKEEAPKKTPNPTMKACVVEEISVDPLELKQHVTEAASEEAAETCSKQAYDETFTKDHLSIETIVEKTSSPQTIVSKQVLLEISPQENPVDTYCKDALIEEISVHPSQQDQSPPSVNLDEVGIYQQKQPTEKVTVHTSQNDQKVVDVSIDEQPAVENPSQEHLVDVLMREVPSQEHQPSVDVSSEDILLETKQDLLPCEVSVDCSQNDEVLKEEILLETKQDILPSEVSVDCSQNDEVLREEILLETKQDILPSEVSVDCSQNDEVLKEEILLETKHDLVSNVVSIDTCQDEVRIDVSPIKNVSKGTQQSTNNKSPEVIVFSNKYSEYRVEDNSENETTIYVTRRKKKKSKSERKNVSQG